MAESQVISIRPAEQEVGQPQFQPSVITSPANIYIQEVKAQTADEHRMSFAWRSPSSGLVASPLAYIRFAVKVTSTCHKLSASDMIGTLVGAQDNNPIGVATTGMEGGALRAGVKYRPLLCFGEGNAPLCAAESIQISVNGSTWTELNTNLYSRSLSRCFEPADVQQKAYSTCGGSCLRFDDTPLSGHVVGIPDNVYLGASATNAPAANRSLISLTAGAVTCGFKPIEGMTMDTSLAQRQRNFASQVKAAATTATESSVTVEVRFPLQGGPFNSLWGSSGLARSDPRLRMALGIPNLNQGVVTIVYKDLIKNVIRRLGRATSVANAAGFAAGQLLFGQQDISVAYVSDETPVLELTYIRLPAFRSYPQSSALAIYRRDCRRADGQKHGGHAFSKELFDGSGALVGLRCALGDNEQPSAHTVRPQGLTVVTKDKNQYDAKWTGLQWPQVPNQIFICFQKSSAVYNLRNPMALSRLVNKKMEDTTANIAGQTLFNAHGTSTITSRTHDAAIADNAAEKFQAFGQYIANRYIAQNQGSNAAILQLEITVQSAVGSWSFRTQNYPYLQDRDLLWRKHQQNCCEDYMPAGRGFWQDRASCALLASSDFLLGISSGPGVTFPIIMDIKCKFANRAAVSSGACFTNGMAKGRYVFEDIICGEPVCVGLFNQQILSIAASSAVLSAQAFSQQTYAAAVSQSQ